MTESLREQIFNEAKKLFFVYGFKRITMDEIAASCKISKKTLYQIYPSKELLIKECTEKIVGEKVASIHNIIDSDVSVWQIFKAFFDMFKSFSHDVSQAMIQDIRLMPDIWNIIEEKRMTVFERMEQIVERGQQDGSIKPALNTDLFLRVYMGILQKFVNPIMFSEMNISPAEFMSQLEIIIFEGILTDEAKKEVNKDE